MKERNLQRRQLQHSRKHGRMSSCGNGRLRFNDGETTMITDRKGKRVITAFGSPAPGTSRKTGLYKAFEDACHRDDMKQVHALHDEIMYAQQTDRLVQAAVCAAREGASHVEWTDRRLNLSSLALELAWDRNVPALRYLLQTFHNVSLHEPGSKSRPLTQILFRVGLPRQAVQLCGDFPERLQAHLTSGGGNTLLTYAGATGHKQLFHELVAQGLNPFLRNKQGHTPISKLLNNSSIGFVTVAIRFESARNKQGSTWVPVAAVGVRAHGGAPRGLEIGGGMMVAPVCNKCMVWGYERHFLEPTGRKRRQPLLEPPAGLDRHVLQLIVHLSGVGRVGCSESETTALPRFSAAVWLCSWCRRPLEKKEYDYSRFYDSDSDEHSMEC